MSINTCSRPSHKRTNSLPKERLPCNNRHPLRELRSLRSLTACKQEESLLSNKPVVGKPSREQIKRAEQERVAVEKRMAAEALAAKKMAEEQAKVWADAENRALGIARSDVDQVARHATFSVDSSPAVRAAPVARARRKQSSSGRLLGFIFKLGLFLLVLLVGALFVDSVCAPDEGLHARGSSDAF